MQGTAASPYIAKGSLPTKCKFTWGRIEGLLRSGINLDINARPGTGTVAKHWRVPNYAARWAIRSFQPSAKPLRQTQNSKGKHPPIFFLSGKSWWRKASVHHVSQNCIVRLWGVLLKRRPKNEDLRPKTPWTKTKTLWTKTKTPWTKTKTLWTKTKTIQTKTKTLRTKTKTPWTKTKTPWTKTKTS